MTFTHPLTGVAKVWTADPVDGAQQRLPVGITTLELDPGGPRYRRKLVARLSRAAREFVAGSTDRRAGLTPTQPGKNEA
jgi:hypothetical protein